MKISIITPCFNSEKYISETIESVISQRGNFEIEYILIDGCSTDKTTEIVNRYSDLIKSNQYSIKCNGISLKFISEADNGMYDALIKGFSNITGDIVAYINSDDFYLPNAFSTVTDIFTKYEEVKWLTGMFVMYNDKGQIINCSLPGSIARSSIKKGLACIQQESIFWRKELMIHIDYDRLSGFKLAGDYFIWFTFAAQAELYIVQSCFSGFRKHAGQLSENSAAYFEDLSSYVETPTYFDRIKYSIMRRREYLPNRVKRLLNSKIIFYKENMWVKTR